MSTKANRTGKQGRRLTQAERSSITKGRLLDATIESLIDVGYSRTTTVEVGERAGMSRGAQLHHFPSKADLLIAAVEHLAEERAREIEEEFEARVADGGDEVSLVIDMLWASFSGPLWWAALELTVAARTDDELRSKLEVLEKRLAGRIYRGFEELVDVPAADARKAMRMTLMFLRGLAIERIFRGDEEHYRELVDEWKGFVHQMLARSSNP